MGFTLPLDVTWLTGIIAYADTAIDCRHAEAAQSLFDQLEPFAAQWHYSDISTTGPLSRTLGGLAAVLGRYEEAQTFLPTPPSRADELMQISLPPEPISIGGRC